MEETTRLWNMDDDEIIEAIRNRDFNLYGNFKDEKKKLKDLMDENDVEFRIGRNIFGGRALEIRVWNPNPTRDNEPLYFEVEYSY
jgi:small-conductance mechanosensitive channel